MIVPLRARGEKVSAQSGARTMASRQCVRVNTNGSHDLGPMQVNDRLWLPHVADFGPRWALSYVLIYRSGRHML